MTQEVVEQNHETKEKAYYQCCMVNYPDDPQCSNRPVIRKCLDEGICQKCFDKMLTSGDFTYEELDEMYPLLEL